MLSAATGGLQAIPYKRLAGSLCDDWREGSRLPPGSCLPSGHAVCVSPTDDSCRTSRRVRWPSTERGTCSARLCSAPAGTKAAPAAAPAAAAAAAAASGKPRRLRQTCRERPRGDCRGLFCSLSQSVCASHAAGPGAAGGRRSCARGRSRSARVTERHFHCRLAVCRHRTDSCG